VSLVGVMVDPALGDIDIQGGDLGFETTTTSMGNSASNLFIRAGATVSFFGTTSLWNKVFNVTGDGLHTNIYDWSGDNVIIGPVCITNNCLIGGPGSSLEIDGPISGPGSLTKIRGDTLILGGLNTYAGNTVISNGTLALSGTSSLANSPAIKNYGILDASGR